MGVDNDGVRARADKAVDFRCGQVADLGCRGVVWAENR